MQLKKNKMKPCPFSQCRNNPYVIEYIVYASAAG